MNRHGKKVNILGILFACLLGTVNAQTTTKYEHRGYLGSLVDLSHKVVDAPWPSVNSDDDLTQDYEETLDFMQLAVSQTITHN